MHLVGLGRAQHRSRDQDGGDVQGRAEQPHAQEGHQDGEEGRNHRQHSRGAAAEDEEEDDEDQSGGDEKALRQRRHEARADLGLQQRLADGARRRAFEGLRVQVGESALKRG